MQAVFGNNLYMHLKIAFLIVLSLLSNVICAQLKYPVVGTYKGKSAQGMAIRNNQAFLFSNGGRCRVLNLINGIIEFEFMLDSADTLNHVNCACFLQNGVDLLYISECRGEFRCFVEEVDGKKSELKQTIVLKNKKGKNAKVLNWVVDSENSFIYAIIRDAKSLNSNGVVHNYFYKFKLPMLEEGIDVILETKNCKEQFEASFPNILQGAKIRNNMMYIVTGLPETASHRRNSKRAIHVIDLEKKRLVKTIDLTYVTTNEPEDIDFYNGKCLLYCGQNGGIYEVDLK